MTVFDKINETIQEAISENKLPSLYLGFFDYKDFDDEDVKELETWEEVSGSSTLNEKTISGIKFTLDVISS